MHDTRDNLFLSYPLAYTVTQASSEEFIEAMDNFPLKDTGEFAYLQLLKQQFLQSLQI